MRRRELVVGLGAVASSAIWSAAAQQAAIPVIGYLSARSMEADASAVAALRRGLDAIGFTDGRNIAIEYRFADYRLERLPALAADLVRRQVAVIVAVPTPAALAAKAATKSIPIVFVAGVDPVQSGLVASLARPGGNVTGMSNINVEVAAKRLELLHELLPATTLIAYLRNPTNAIFTEPETRELEIASRTLGVRLLIVNATDISEFEPAFATIVRERAGGLVVSGESLFITNPTRLVALAGNYQVPAVYPSRGATAVGGLMSYGGGGNDGIRQFYLYIGRILKGEKPADLPVQQSTIIELVINMQTAKALGLTFPLMLLGRADAAIE